jgi:lipoate-protein ligase A
MRAYLLRTPPLDVFDHMALDEAVLEDAARSGLPVFYFRIYNWDKSHTAVTFGISQKYEDVSAAVRERDGGVTMPLVRRTTGGGIVYHDGDITFSFVFPWPHLTAPSLIYKNMHLGVHLGLKTHRIPSRLWSPADKSEAAPAECFAAPVPIDLVHENGTKILGGALRRRKGVGLYQGSMRTEGFGEAREVLLQALQDGFDLQWRSVFNPVSPEPKVAAAAKQLRLEKYAVEGWNKKR